MGTARVVGTAGAMLVGWSISTPARAIPAFARREHLACTVCHSVFPQINAVGRVYKENGYRFVEDGGKSKTNGDDLGSGIVIDKLPGISFRVVSIPFGVAPDERGREAPFTQPLESAELFAGGGSGDNWSYFAEIESEAENDYATQGNGLVQCRFVQPFSLFAGWTTAFSRDVYNSLSESRRIDRAPHAATDFAGTIDVPMNEEGGWVGGYGAVWKLFWLAETGPGPGIPDSLGEPLDYVGRVAVDIAKPISVGAFVYSANTIRRDTVRIGLDENSIGSFGTLYGVVMYDTLDRAVGIEANWDIAKPVGKANLNLVPEARVDVRTASGDTWVAPTVGFGFQRSTGRILVEATQRISGRDTPPPTAQVIVDALF